MTLHIESVTVLWFIVNVATFILTLFALVSARRDLGYADADQTLRSAARRLTARGNVRREALRVVIQVLLLSLVIPAVLSSRPITLTPAIIALILVPVVLLISTIYDARDRRQLATMLLDLVRAEQRQQEQPASSLVEPANGAVDGGV